MSALSFTGILAFRSSRPNASGPPGEAEVLTLNPQRSATICKITGWDRLQAGSLNLTVPNGVVDDLKALKPTWTELGRSVNYPPQYAYIPLRREAYLYYLADAAAHDKQQEVLVRTAKNPIAGRVELFASLSLVTSLGLGEGDPVTVKVRAKSCASGE
jgi:hypothetical protein